MPTYVLGNRGVAGHVGIVADLARGAVLLTCCQTGERRDRDRMQPGLFDHQRFVRDAVGLAMDPAVDLLAEARTPRRARQKELSAAMRSMAEICSRRV